MISSVGNLIIIADALYVFATNIIITDGFCVYYQQS